MAGLQEVLLSPNTMESVTLPMVRYRIAFEVTEPVHLPEYSGSTIRGAFGGALRRVACMTRQKDCKACPLYRSCPYTDIFETPPPEEHTLQKFSQIPNAYVIEPPNWGARTYENGETLEFQLYLHSSAHFHAMLAAAKRSLKHCSQNIRLVMCAFSTAKKTAFGSMSRKPRCRSPKEKRLCSR